MFEFFSVIAVVGWVVGWLVLLQTIPDEFVCLGCNRVRPTTSKKIFFHRKLCASCLGGASCQ